MATRQRRQQGTGTVFQRKDGRWIGRIETGYTPSGNRRTRSVTASTEAEAKVKLKALQAQIIREGVTTASSRATIKTWADTWLEHTQRIVRPSTWASNASAVRRWIVPTIGKVRLDELTPAHVRAVATAIEHAGRTSSTAHRAHVVLVKMLRDATVEGHAVPPRVLLVTAPGSGKSDRDAIPVPDALALLAAAAEQPDGSRWVAALLQGMRQAECLGLTWDAVDLERGTIDVSWQLQALPYLDREAGTFRVPRNYETRHLWRAFHLVRPKSAAGQRLIPLVPWMTAALTQWRDVAPPSPHGLVWPRPDGRPQSAKADALAWVALQDAAQVARWDGTYGRRYVVHEARHTTATLLLEGGVSEAVIIAIMGHSTIVTTRGYQHVSTPLARQALEQIAGRLNLIEL